MSQLWRGLVLFVIAYVIALLALLLVSPHVPWR